MSVSFILSSLKSSGRFDGYRRDVLDRVEEEGEEKAIREKVNFKTFLSLS